MSDELEQQKTETEINIRFVERPGEEEVAGFFNDEGDAIFIKAQKVEDVTSVIVLADATALATAQVLAFIAEGIQSAVDEATPVDLAGPDGYDDPEAAR